MQWRLRRQARGLARVGEHGFRLRALGALTIAWAMLAVAAHAAPVTIANSPGGKPNTIPRAVGDASVAGFGNDQTAAAVADANATLFVAPAPTAVIDVPTLSRSLLALLAVLVGAVALRRQGRR